MIATTWFWPLQTSYDTQCTHQRRARGCADIPGTCQRAAVAVEQVKEVLSSVNQ